MANALLGSNQDRRLMMTWDVVFLSRGLVLEEDTSYITPVYA